MAYNKGNFYHEGGEQVLDGVAFKGAEFSSAVALPNGSTIDGVKLMTSSEIPTTEKKDPGTLCMVTAPGSIGLYIQEGTLAEPSWKKVSAGDNPPVVENGYVTFSGNVPFSVNIYDQAVWDGTVEYSTDKETWTTWDGTSVNSNASNEIYFRGSNNTVFSGEHANGFEFGEGVEITITGNLENLLDYETVMAGNHPPMAEHCLNGCFFGQVGLLTTGELGSTTLAPYCYHQMYANCGKLQVLPALPALNMAEACYASMFGADSGFPSSIKLSETQTGLYVNEFRIPSSGVGDDTGASGWNDGMFVGSTGTFTGDPQLNTTYYYYMEEPEPEPDEGEPDEGEPEE